MTKTVLITTYNGQDYILDQMKSIYNQTITPDEVVIIDDHSSDDTVKIIEDFINMNNLSSWLLLENKNNKGWKANFHDGISLTHGEAVLFCDQDDIWMPRKIEIEVGLLEENPDANVICSEQKYFYDNNYCFPDDMKRVSLYKPVERGFEREIKKRFEYWNTFRKK